jgi:hypothetical protein
MTCLKRFCPYLMLVSTEGPARVVSEKISALMMEDYLERRRKRARKRDFREILAKVPSRTPILGDER